MVLLEIDGDYTPNLKVCYWLIGSPPQESMALHRLQYPLNVSKAKFIHCFPPQLFDNLSPLGCVKEDSEPEFTFPLARDRGFGNLLSTYRLILQPIMKHP